MEFMKDEDLKELLEKQKRTLELLEETQELLRKQDSKIDSLELLMLEEAQKLLRNQDSRIDSLKQLMNVEYVCLVFLIVFYNVFMR